jgi:hypothetical protein
MIVNHQSKQRQRLAHCTGIWHLTKRGVSVIVIVTNVLCVSRLTAQSNARPLVQPCQGQVQNLATDVVKKDIEVSYCMFELILKRWTLVVQRCVYLELFREPTALIVRARNSDDFRAEYFADLTCYRAHRAGSARDYEGLTSLDLSNV